MGGSPCKFQVNTGLIIIPDLLRIHHQGEVHLKTEVNNLAAATLMDMGAQ